MKLSSYLVAMSLGLAALHLGTKTFRKQALSELSSLEQAIAQDWVALSKSTPDLKDVSSLSFEGSAAVSRSQFWARQFHFPKGLLNPSGHLQAQALLIPFSDDSNQPQQVLVQYYIYRRLDRNFVTELHRIYGLTSNAFDH